MQKKHTIFVDTKHNNQNPSQFKIKLPDYFIRNPSNRNVKCDWYLSLKNFAMINSFSNISSGINDSIVLFQERVADSVVDIPLTLADIDSALFEAIEIVIPEGNPNVNELEDKFNELLAPYNIEATYVSYNSSFRFDILFPFANMGQPILKKFLYFKTSYELFGMRQDHIYPFYDLTHNPTTSFTNVNLLGDYLLKFHINSQSDFKLKNTNYCNMGTNFRECDLFFMLNINVLPYDVIYYQRTTEDLIPIQLFKDTINEFQINITNQDNQAIEGLADWQGSIELICVEKQEHIAKILDLLKHIYLWIGTYFSKKMI